MRQGAALVALALSGWVAACGSGSEPSARNATQSAKPAQLESTSTEEATGSPSADVATWQLPLPALQYNAREGQAVFRHYCAPCHGEGGGGDGFNAYNLDPKPRDLTDPGFQAQHTDEDLVTFVRDGGGAVGLSSAMPPWGRTLNEREITNVVRFVRTIKAASDQRGEE